jgi:uncharacterized protein (TIRG00374 family)
MLSVISIIALIAFTISTNTVNSLININPIFLFAALAFQFLSWLMWAARMKTMSEAIGGEISLKNSVTVILSSLFAASITPAHAGSEVVRVQLLRRFKLSIGDASAVVLGEDMLDALFLGMAAPIGFILFQHQMKSNIGLTALFASAAILLLTIFLVIFYAITKPKKVKSLATKFRWLFIKFRGCKKADEMMTMIFREIDVFHDSITTYLKEGRRALGKGFVYTIAFWTFQFSIASLILVGLGSQPWILPSFSAQTVLTLIVILPLTPGNSGVAELSTASIYSAFVSTSILGVFILAWRSVTYYLNILVGGFVSLKILKGTKVIEGAVDEVIGELG